MPDPILPPPLDDATAGAAIDAAVALHGIPLDPAWRGDAAQNLKAIAGAFRLVAEFPLDDELEPAPVFRA